MDNIPSILSHKDSYEDRKNSKDDSYQSHEMDGDSSHRAMMQGASSALKEQDFGSGIHEDAKPRNEPVGEKTTGHAQIFSSEGAIGKHFTSEGAVGGTGQKVGGPMDKGGAIGKHFNEDGAVGGNVQQTLGSREGSSVDHGSK